MNEFITLHTDREIYIRSSAVEFVSSSNPATENVKSVVTVSGKMLAVKETPAEVLALLAVHLPAGEQTKSQQPLPNGGKKP